jgi:hypothetical protein
MIFINRTSNLSLVNLLKFLFKMVNCYLSIKITKIIKILNIKGYPSSHPVIKPINNVYDIEEAFDSVETAKVAAILRMIEYEIGEQIMWNAIGVYIE